MIYCAWMEPYVGHWFDLRRTAVVAALALLVGGGSSAGRAAALVLDDSFGTGGVVVGSEQSVISAATAITVLAQPDGQVVMATAARVDGSTRTVLLRFTAAGTLDQQFGNGGIAAGGSNGGSIGVRVLRRQSDGRYLVLSGADTESFGPNGARVERFTAQGAVDPEWGGGAPVLVGQGQLAYPSDLLALPNGRVLIAATAASLASTRVFALTAGGVPDGDFAGGGELAVAPADPALILRSGRLLPQGGDDFLTVTVASGNVMPNFARLDLRSFDGGGGPRTDYGVGGALSTVLAESGAAFAQPLSGTATADQRAITLASGRLFSATADGEADAAFGAAGILATTAGPVVEADGEALWLLPTRAGRRVLRLTRDGSPDATFGSGGEGQLPLSAAYDIRAWTRQLDGRLLAAGRVTLDEGIIWFVARFASALPTPTPTSSETPLPAPTVTGTSPPTATQTPLPTATDTTAPTVTDTPEPTVTDSPAPTATDTPSPTATPDGDPDCCAAGSGAGCGKAACELCVCAVDSFCCGELWDRGCATIAADTCAADCGCGSVCVGDCDGNRTVTIAELIRMTTIALGTAPLSACAAADVIGDGQVGISDLVLAVLAALQGCPA